MEAYRKLLVDLVGSLSTGNDHIAHDLWDCQISGNKETKCIIKFMECPGLPVYDLLSRFDRT